MGFEGKWMQKLIKPIPEGSFQQMEKAVSVEKRATDIGKDERQGEDELLAVSQESGTGEEELRMEYSESEAVDLVYHYLLN